MIRAEDVKLVIADVDNTLVAADRIVSEYTKGIINKLRANGVMFGISSGREYHTLLEDNKNWGFEEPFDVTVGMNGGQVYIASSDKAYEYYLMKPETIREVVEMMEPLDLNPFFYGDAHTIVSWRRDDDTSASGRRNGMNLHIVESREEFWAKPINKIMYRIDREKMPEAEAWAKAHPGKNYQSFKTQPIMIEFQDPHINKGTGLQKVCELKGITCANVIAFGDMQNDNEMIMEAGWGVCLKNGSDETKAVSDDITEYTTAEDGLARYIADHFPELLK